MMNWILLLKHDGSNYQIIESGSNIVPTEEYDKVLPTTERIARQSDKVYFDGNKLCLKEGVTLMSVEELNTYEDSRETVSSNKEPIVYDIP